MFSLSGKTLTPRCFLQAAQGCGGAGEPEVGTSGGQELLPYQTSVINTIRTANKKQVDVLCKRSKISSKIILWILARHHAPSGNYRPRVQNRSAKPKKQVIPPRPCAWVFSYKQKTKRRRRRRFVFISSLEGLELLFSLFPTKTSSRWNKSSNDYVFLKTT